MIDGPVSGSIITLPICFGPGANGITYTHTIDLPAGMALKIVAISVKAVNIVSDPSLTIGSTVGGAEFVAAVNITDGLACTLVATDVTDLLSVRLINDAGDAFDNATVTITAYVSAPPTSLVERNINHA
jgi:hypothetical protein